MMFTKKLAVCAVLTLVALAPATAGVVTLDSVEKSTSSDTADLEPMAVKARPGQVGAFVKNNSLAPVKFTLKVTGLKSGDYDIYVNDVRFQVKMAEELRKQFGMPEIPPITERGEVIRGKTSAQLEQGIEISIPGSVSVPRFERCLKAMQPHVREAADILAMYCDEQSKRALGTIKQAIDWVSSGLTSDETYRSAQIIVAPAGVEPQEMLWRHRQDAEQVGKSQWRACRLLQLARSRMFSVITDKRTRDLTVAALTPVDFLVSYTILNGKPHVHAKVVNDLDIPISARITMALPKGWKTTAKSLDFPEVKSGETLEVQFRLIPPVAGEKPPETLPIAANLVISEVIDTADLDAAPPQGAPSPGPREYKAEMKLRSVVTRN